MGLFLFNTIFFWAVVLSLGFGGTDPGSLFSQYMILYIAINLSLYAFRNYDLQRFWTFHQAALSVFSGTIVGVVASLPFLLLFFYLPLLCLSQNQLLCPYQYFLNEH